MIGRHLASLVVLLSLWWVRTGAADTPPSPGPAPNTPTKNEQKPDPNAPANNTPKQDPNAPATNTPAKDPPTNNTPANDTPANNTPANNTPANNTPANNTPAKNTPANNTPTNTPANAPTDPNAPTTSAPIAPAPTTPTTNAPTTPATGPTIVTGKVTDVLGRPVSNARVYVMPRRGQPHQTKTGRDGRYKVEVHGAGTHGVVIAIDRAHTFRTVLVQRGMTNTMDVDIELDTEGGEVIKIEDKRRPEPKVKAKPKHDVAKSLPYSDEAVERDAWARAWMLLDVDERGTVTRLKLLKAPGFGLDKICIDEAFKLRFSPALDGAGKPMKTYMLWTFEWPAWGWLIQGNGTAMRRPVDRSDMQAFRTNSLTSATQDGGKIGGTWATPTTAESAGTAFETSMGRVPCAGSGPLNLDMRNRTYRDCSTPDMDAAPALPWITRETAEAAVAELSNPNLIVVEEVRPGSRVPTIIAASVTGVIAIGAIVSYFKYSSAVDRVVQYQWQATIDPEQYQGHLDARDRWGARALGLTAATVIAGGVTLLLWHRNMPRKSFSVQPSEKGSGASAMFTTDF